MAQMRDTAYPYSNFHAVPLELKLHYGGNFHVVPLELKLHFVVI